MKKNVLLLLVLICFGTFVGYSEDTLSHTDFVGFEGVELTFDEAKLITGGETYIGYTHVSAGKYHSLIVITDKAIDKPGFKVKAVYESGPENSFVKSSSSSLGYGNNVKQTYNEPEKVQANPTKYKLQKVEPPKGMSTQDYDKKVDSTAKAYFKEKQKKYSIKKNSCNTTTSTIIKRSGGKIKPKKRVPGWKK